MKKFYTVFFSLFLILSFHTVTGQVLSFSFSGINGDEASVGSSAEAPGVQPSSISRGPGVTASATADRFNSKNWTTASAVDLNDYLEFVITPSAGYSITLSNIILQHQRSNSGPTSFVIRTSLDGFASDATNVVNVPDVNTTQSSTFSFSPIIVTSSPVTIRIYAYNAESANGTWGPGESSDGNDILVSGSLAILPVRFGNVKAVQKNNKVEISWTNLTESDLLQYSIEWSPDGRNFTEITKIDPVKNNGGSADYQYLDAHPLSRVNFYRIKAIETNGHFVYSHVMKIEAGMPGTAVAVYPNPARQGAQVAIQLNNIPAGSYIVNVYNATAQLMRSQTIMVSGSSLVQTLPLANWQKGMYILEITGSVKLQKQFVVQ